MPDMHGMSMNGTEEGATFIFLECAVVTSKGMKKICSAKGRTTIPTGILVRLRSGFNPKRSVLETNVDEIEDND